jgi:hypothetical protein
MAADTAHRDSLMKGQGFRRGPAGLDQVAVLVPTIGFQFPDLKVDSLPVAKSEKTGYRLSKDNRRSIS